MNDTYRNAVSHLTFSEIRLEESQRKPSRRFRVTRAVAIAATLVTLLATTAFAAIVNTRQIPTVVEPIGTVQEDMTDAEPMHFSVSGEVDGVRVHYIEFAGAKAYSFHNGLLKTPGDRYYRVTEDYQLESVEMNHVNHKLDKNGKTYTLDFEWLDTEKGVLSNHRYIYQPDYNNEIFLNATDGRSGQWPVYLNILTGEVRDALPDWTADDFNGRIGYTYLVNGGMIVSTIDETAQKHVSRQYWIAPGAEEAKLIEMPEGARISIEHGNVYYQNDRGQLYQMDEDFTFRQISEYKTSAYIENGLLLVSVNNKLGILDVQCGEVYVLDDIRLTPPNYMEMLDYAALRYGTDGRIALMRTEWVTNESEFRIEMNQIGILDTQNGKLGLLTIENDYNAYQGYWLDENRFAVIYQDDLSQYLCIYEFTA
ncbi:MAG: hypothetical protein UHS47_12850 [Oscillospiraceae bacterium]|nr:hypothetical protein [Oscillospiraceae bacterium]